MGWGEVECNEKYEARTTMTSTDLKTSKSVYLKNVRQILSLFKPY